jgi:nicotinate dehydrogenase subunit B
MKRADFHAARGVLLVVRDPPPAPPPVKGQPAAVPGNPAEGVEILLAVWADGRITALAGHVDLGTGLRTALTQVVAEELDAEPGRVELIMGSTGAAPNQGATIASASLQIHAAPLRTAAAQAAAWLRTHTLQADSHVVLTLDPATPVKDPAQYRLVGTSLPRVDLPAKATGELVFVHDMRVPGMLHGRVVRPPYAGADHGDFIGRTLEGVERESVAHIPGLRAIVVQGDFVGVVAEREEAAEAAMQALVVRWKPWPGLPQVAGDIEGALRAHASTPRRLVDEGDVEAAQPAQALERTYLWPYQLHASIGPSCAVAHWESERLTVWAGTQNPHVLRADLAKLTGLADTAVEVVRLEAAGCYGRNGADDVAADAALLSRAVNAPVRVQLTREQEAAWEPKGAAQWMHVKGGLDEAGRIAAWDFETSYPSNGAPTLALLLTRAVVPVAQAFEMGDRTARPPYAAPNQRVTVHDMAPVLRASWLRGVSALPNSFAHESYVDELAHAAGADPVAFRLQHLGDERAAELVRATAQRAGWQPHTQPQQQGASGDWLHGQGFAYARYMHSKWPGFGAAWAAWVADVDVNKLTGEVNVKRVVVGHDAGLMVNPAGVQQQIHGNVLQTTSRALKEQVAQDAATGTVLNREWGSYPILSFREVPVIEVMTMPRPGEPPLGAGESSSVPGTAAIANAIFDATGVRFREPPFTAEKVRAALNPLPAPAAAGPTPADTSPRAAPAHAPWPRRRGLWAAAGALATGVLGFFAGVLGGKPALAPSVQADLSLYSPATLERGRQLAAAGNCVGCHTVPGGAPNAGGHALQTPFGTVYASNLTPDVETGIGAWSLQAFVRAMREGLSRDGRRLYPAFPYTAFAKLSDDDLTALYAHLMAQPVVRATPPPHDLRFPFNQRPLLALWNGLFHEATPWQPEPGRSAEWNRGAYLVNGVGHCGACHTPRNALGAERRGAAFLAGAMVEGWEAQPLTAASHAPVAWTADEFRRYLRDGHTQWHGAAAGPMAGVVRELRALPDEDLRAMAVYLASFQGEALVDEAGAARRVQAANVYREHSAAERLFEGACGACHHDGSGPQVFGLNLPLALNSNLHSPRPDNLLQVLLLGIREVPGAAHGTMPAFREHLSDAQLAELAAYLRRRFAPDQPAWADLAATAARLRAMR